MEAREDMRLTTSKESTFTIRLRIFRCFAMQIPLRKAHNSAIKTEVVPIDFENPWTQFPFESRIRPPAPAWPFVTEASVLNLCQPGGGLAYLAFSRALARDGLLEAVRK